MDVLTSSFGVLSLSYVETIGIAVLVCVLGFTGAPLWLWTVLSAAVLWTFGAPGGLWWGFGALALLLNVRPLRRNLISSPILKILKALPPPSRHLAHRTGRHRSRKRMDRRRPLLRQTRFPASERRTLPRFERKGTRIPQRPRGSRVPAGRRLADSPGPGPAAGTLGLSQRTKILRDHHPRRIRRPWILRLGSQRHCRQAGLPLDASRRYRNGAQFARTGRTADPLRHP